MNDPVLVYFAWREEWRRWLELNHDKAKEVWLVYYKKPSGKPRISYEDAVEEALCFGWVDSLVKKLDDERYAQKFTPRKNTSKWSQSNLRRIKKLMAEGRMTAAGMAKYECVVENPERILPERTPSTRIDFPDDLIQELDSDLLARDNFLGYSQSYQDLCLRWINAAKKGETRAGRIAEVVELAGQGRKIGLK